MKRVKIAAAVGVAGLILGSGIAISSADPDTTVVQPPPITVSTDVTPPLLTVTLPPPPPPITTTVTEPPVTITAPPPPPVTTTVTAPPVTTTVTAPPSTTTVTVTPPPTTTTTTTTTTPTTTTTEPPPPCGAPITITTGGTYSGCYQSNSTSTPAVTISTTAPVTLSKAHIIAKGNGLQGVNGTRLTITDSVFDQTDPGAVVKHRAVELNQPASFIFTNNRLTDTDGIWIGGGSPNPFTVDANLATNIGRYPHPISPNCCVQFLQLDHVVTSVGHVYWNHTRNVYGQSGIEDNISMYASGGTDSTHRFDIGWNLIDGAYPRATNCQDSCGADYRGGGIMLGDGSGGGHNMAHDNTVVSTTNYGIEVALDDNYATNNLLINDAVEQSSNFGQAITGYGGFTPPGAHATGTKYNWRRSTTDPGQASCYPTNTCTGGTQVSTTEQQARDMWDVSRAAASVIVGPRP